MTENEMIQSLAKEHVIRASGLLSLLMPQICGIGIGIKGLVDSYPVANNASETLIQGAPA